MLILFTIFTITDLSWGSLGVSAVPGDPSQSGSGQPPSPSAPPPPQKILSSSTSKIKVSYYHPSPLLQEIPGTQEYWASCHSSDRVLLSPAKLPCEGFFLCSPSHASPPPPPPWRRTCWTSSALPGSGTRPCSCRWPWTRPRWWSAGWWTPQPGFCHFSSGAGETGLHLPWSVMKLWSFLWTLNCLLAISILFLEKYQSCS